MFSRMNAFNLLYSAEQSYHPKEIRHMCKDHRIIQAGRDLRRSLAWSPAHSRASCEIRLFRTWSIQSGTELHALGWWQLSLSGPCSSAWVSSWGTSFSYSVWTSHFSLAL